MTVMTQGLRWRTSHKPALCQARMLTLSCIPHQPALEGSALVPI